ncbi:hypothetical protein V2K77_01745 [Pseudomonas alliivorans]|nr:hypothetical protein [Pseudomonas alliivorans]MEE4710216.1 hypothetical protein [Pseudomonas alliivorans]MEE4725177.1 hypothetical protein [Pseudomonas alliivorans]MEE4765962.1 hypothetical protein [Pseudomonas alliivorans]
MSNEFKLKPCRQGSGHAGQWCGPLFDCWLDPRPRKERDADFESRKAVAMAGQRLVETQPPALGGDQVEIGIGPDEIIEELLMMANMADDSDDHDGHLMYMRWLARIRSSDAKAAPLQAEIERLQSLSVTNIMLDVMPGDGSGLEVFAKSVKEVEEAISTQYYALENVADERDQLKARNAELEKNHRRYEWIRSQGTKWSELSPALFERVNDECNPPYMALKFGEELDSAIDASISRAALSKPAGGEQV